MSVIPTKQKKKERKSKEPLGGGYCFGQSVKFYYKCLNSSLKIFILNWTWFVGLFLLIC